VGGSNTSGTVSGSHLYAGPGIYTVTLKVKDKDGGTATSTYQYAVVYDPDGPFVTGGGWIESPAGAYAANPALTGKASAEFVSKYHAGRTTPDGNTRFHFQAAGFDFASTSYAWLVVKGAKAQYTGAGTVNGAAGYGFWLSAIDGAPDRFRIRIWNLASGTVVYDNQGGASDTADPTTILGGGSITIHP
jgi:PKD repeat protein